MTANAIKKSLRQLSDTAIAEHSNRFFKTGPGEYGEGDRFLGIRVPELRKLVGAFRDTPREEIRKVLVSPYHEERLFALLLMVWQFNKGGPDEQESVYRMYLANTKFINSWDLVDSSAPHIVGSYLEDRDRRALYELAQSTSLWERRIAVLATLHFIRNQDFDDTLELSRMLLDDPEDLIHKAVGWMLREVGRRDIEVARQFLQTAYARMPRTMLRYAIEKFPEPERKQFLRGTV